MTRRWLAIVAAVALAAPGIAGPRPSKAPSRWIAAWGSSQFRLDPSAADAAALAGPVTIRQTVRLTAAGRRLRVRLSNLAGTAPLTVAAATVALPVVAGRPAVGAATLRPLAFSGAAAATIAAGAELTSDPVDLPVAPGTDLVVSLHLAEPPAVRTGHPGSRATGWAKPGDAAADPAFAGATAIGGWHQLAEIEVETTTSAGVVVAIGDSITDGYGIRPDSNTRWPDMLAERLRPRGLAVVNGGIGGNRILLDGTGPSLLARFDREVLTRAGVRHAIVLEGINDLGTLTRDAPATPEAHRAIVARITGAYRELAARAHARGIRLIGGTITPFVGNGYYHPDALGEADRQAINAWIRAAGIFDAVVDFDRVVRDPARPDRFAPAFDSGDHLHPSEAGYRAMAAAVPLALFDPAARAPAPAPRLLAITVDDLPIHGPLAPGETRVDVARRIVAALRRHRVPAFGFVNGVGTTTDPEGAAVLAVWRRAGLALGNHGWSHQSLDRLTPADYLAEIDRNEPVLAAHRIAGAGRYYRYPFLAEGSDPAARAAIRTGLARRGYRIAAVTTSFADYRWNEAWVRCAARGDAAAIAGLEAGFLAAARSEAERETVIATASTGRAVPQVLLLHLGSFDARMMDRLLTLYAQLGFRFVPLARAQADAYFAGAEDPSRPGGSLPADPATARLPVPGKTVLPPPSLCR